MGCYEFDSSEWDKKMLGTNPKMSSDQPYHSHSKQSFKFSNVTEVSVLSS